MTALIGKTPQEVGAICTRWVAQFNNKILIARQDMKVVTMLALDKATEVDDYIKDLKAKQPESDDRDALIGVLAQMKELLSQIAALQI